MNDLSKLDHKCIEQAFKNLDQADREMIQSLSLKLEDDIRTMRGRKIMFGPKSSMELLAKLGVFLVKRKINLS
jgi:hypothetical protein